MEYYNVYLLPNALIRETIGAYRFLDVALAVAKGRCHETRSLAELPRIQVCDDNDTVLWDSLDDFDIDEPVAAWLVNDGASLEDSSDDFARIAEIPHE